MKQQNKEKICSPQGRYIKKNKNATTLLNRLIIQESKISQNTYIHYCFKEINKITWVLEWKKPEPTFHPSPICNLTILIYNCVLNIGRGLI